MVGLVALCIHSARRFLFQSSGLLMTSVSSSFWGMGRGDGWVRGYIITFLTCGTQPNLTWQPCPRHWYSQFFSLFVHDRAPFVQHTYCTRTIGQDTLSHALMRPFTRASGGPESGNLSESFGITLESTGRRGHLPEGGQRHVVPYAPRADQHFWRSLAWNQLCLRIS